MRDRLVLAGGEDRGRVVYAPRPKDDRVVSKLHREDPTIARDYLPEALTHQLPAFPAIERLLEALPDADVQRVPIPRDCTDRLECDLATGAWDERYGHLRRLEALDVGLRLLVAELGG